MSVCLLLPSGVSSAAQQEDRVAFNFVDIELSTITKFISGITGKNFIFDERVKGKITIIAPGKLSTKDAFSLFTSVLELKGFTVIPSGVDAYKIVPSAQARQSGLAVSTERTPVNESYMARLIPIKHISPDDALRFLQPVVSKDGHISAFGPGNMLLVIDSGLNIEKLLFILEAIDQPSVKEEPEIIFLKYSSADTVAKVIAEGLKPRPGQPPATAGKVMPDSRLNALILFGDQLTREAMKGLVLILDVPPPEAQGRINVYFLENADASELANVIKGMLGGGQPAPGAAPFEAAKGISITADKATNSLVIVASPGDYQSIEEVIRQLDKRRKQVFVEAMIVEVSIDKAIDLGTKWRAAATRKGEPALIGGVGQVDQTTMGQILSGLQGLTMGGLGNYFTVPSSFVSLGATGDMKVPGLAALFSLNEFKGVVNVLSSPQILTSDNKEAEIIVGENVPFVSKREITTGTSQLFNNIERKDVGITLRITPQITEGDYVKLDIYQEISSVKQEVNPNIIINVGPTTTKRSTKTFVAVKDKQTVVIGGLMQERADESVAKVPFLGDIPLIGWLFKSKSVKKNKTNLLLFITPHIVKEAEAIAQLTSEKQLAFAKANNQYTEGELLVKFKENVSEDNAMLLLLKKGASIIKYMEGVKVYHIKLKEKQKVKDAIKEYQALPEVEYAEPDYKVNIQDAK